MGDFPWTDTSLRQPGPTQPVGHTAAVGCTRHALGLPEKSALRLGRHPDGCVPAHGRVIDPVAHGLAGIHPIAGAAFLLEKQMALPQGAMRWRRLAYPHLFQQLDSWLFPNMPLTSHHREFVPGQGDARLAAWRMFIHAATESPWLGYGWTDLQRVHLRFVDISPHLGSSFAHSHNLFLDLVLWVGIPAGLGISGYLCFWYFSKIRAAHSPEASILLAILGIVGIHAMLELPLHYAYFLLPVGIIIGTLESLEPQKHGISISRKSLASLMAVATAGLTLTIADYTEIERDFYNARFTLANIGQPIVNHSPRTLVLTQLRKRIDLFDVNPRTTIPDTQLDEMIQSAMRNPGAAPMYRLATALAYNNRADEARHWLETACKIVSREDCADMGEIWSRDRQTDSRIATVVWPAR